MALYTVAYKIMFNRLTGINVGYWEITNDQGQVFRRGNSQDDLKAKLIIKKPNFSLNLIKGGSIGFAESYMRGEFETDNLSNLIEITARNIKIIYKFSGLLDFPIVNFLKNIFIEDTKLRSKENIAKHYDLGNYIFSLWRDANWTNSNGIYNENTKDHSDAQNQ